MAEFSIVHLSDLHIGADTLPLNLDNLINSVKEETTGMKNVILCITGDIVDKGVYEKNPFNIEKQEFNVEKQRKIKIEKELNVMQPIYDRYNKNDLYDGLCHYIDPSRVFVDDNESINQKEKRIRGYKYAEECISKF